MNFTQLQDELLMTVQDTSIDLSTRAGTFINEALSQVAEDTFPPSLKEMFTVTTVVSTASVALPSNFSGKLTYAGTADQEIVIADTMEVLLRKYPGLAYEGDVEMVAVESAVLYYQPIPLLARALTCVGYFLPDILVNGTDTPTCVPEFLHRELIVYRAAEIAYNLIEDGVDGKKPNTQMYRQLYNQGLVRMSAWVSRRGRAVTSFQYYV
jgi:hypothetical protein